MHGVVGAATNGRCAWLAEVGVDVSDVVAAAATLPALQRANRADVLYVQATSIDHTAVALSPTSAREAAAVAVFPHR
jgi:hypothetical protein